MQEACNWTNPMSLLSVAMYSFIGMTTIPKLIAPFQIDRAIGNSGGIV